VASIGTIHTLSKTGCEHHTQPGHRRLPSIWRGEISAVLRWLAA
jgi:hypothetical protein